MKRSSIQILESWNEPGFAGFANWLADIQPCIRHSDNRYRLVELLDWQEATLRDALRADDNGRFLHSLILYVQPRRHAKSTLHMLTLLWLVTSRRNFTAACLGNHDQHTQRVQMRPLRRLIRHTPALFKIIGGEAGISKNELKFPNTDGLIQSVTPTAQSAFGDQLNCLWVSDWHACPDLDAFHAFQASLLDSDERLTLIDSNTGPTGDHVHELEQEAENDPGIFLSRLEYRDFDHYCDSAPPWISRTEARRLKRTTLQGAFDRDILGKRGAATNALFAKADVGACRDSYSVPVEGKSLDEMFEGRKFITGGGLDRALSFSLHGDATIWTALAKSTDDSGEPEYWILNQKSIPFSQGRSIKKAIAADHEAFGLQNTVIEQYQAQDVLSWAQDAQIPCERVHATSKDQATVFTELARIVKESRLHIPENLPDLIQEMDTFRYELGPRYPKFGAAKGFHDDRIYSLAWAVWSLRDQELASYELPRVICHSKSPHARLCYLRGGDLILFCAPDCEAHRRVEGMHLQYLRSRVDSELSLPEFFASKVKVAGIKVHQGI